MLEGITELGSKMIFVLFVAPVQGIGLSSDFSWRRRFSEQPNLNQGPINEESMALSRLSYSIKEMFPQGSDPESSDGMHPNLPP